MKRKQPSMPSKVILGGHTACSVSTDMKKLIKKYVTSFPIAVLGLALLLASMLQMQFGPTIGSRDISETPKEYEITLNNMKLDQAGRIHNKDNVFLRLSFDATNVLEIGRG